MHGYPANSPYYRVVQVSFATNFRRLRAADLLSFYGYPLHGYALLRDLKDEAAYLAGVLHGLTSIRLLRGYGELSDPPTEESLRRLRTARKREQLRIRDLIYGKKSGLSADALRFIALWERLFHEEVHGSNLTLFVEAEDAFQGIDDFPVLPVPREQALGMFMNRSVEVAWLLLRVLPILQPAPGAFGAAWRSQWEVLDDSCGRYIDSFPEISQDFKAAIAELLQQRFPFSPNTAYSEGASV